MRFRRRRKFNGLWLPQGGEVAGTTLNSLTIVGTSPGAFVGAVGEIVQGAGYFNTVSAGASANVPGMGLLASSQQAWISKRIVGSVFVGVGNSAGASAVGTAIVGAAIFKESVTENNALETGHFDKYNPLDQATGQVRRLWQRIWVLNNPWYTQSGSGLLAAGIDFPTSNAEYGSIREGTHVDVKVKATMELGTNLYFGLWATTLQVAEGNEGDCDIWFIPNLRCFGKTFQRSGAF